MLEIINQKYMSFLFEIANKPKNVSELAKKGDLTLSVASTLISRWAMQGVVLKEKIEGGRTMIHLTGYGKEQVDLLKKIKVNFKNNKLEMISKIDDDKAQKGGGKWKTKKQEN